MYPQKYFTLNLIINEILIFLLNNFQTTVYTVIKLLLTFTWLAGCWMDFKYFKIVSSDMYQFRTSIDKRWVGWEVGRWWGGIGGGKTPTKTLLGVAITLTLGQDKPT